MIVRMQGDERYESNRGWYGLFQRTDNLERGTMPFGRFTLTVLMSPQEKKEKGWQCGPGERLGCCGLLEVPESIDQAHARDVTNGIQV